MLEIAKIQQFLLLLNEQNISLVFPDVGAKKEKPFFFWLFVYLKSGCKKFIWTED
jgi:hypothetical protein